MNDPRARWLVDGLNVVGARPDGWWRDRRGAMRRLLALLDAHAAATGERLHVVFDGTPFELPALSSDRLSVAFAHRRGPDAADDDIARRVEADRDPGSLRVVTSDASLARRVEELGARVVGAGDFRGRLEEQAG